MDRSRTASYTELSERLAELDDDEFGFLVAEIGRDSPNGWASHGTVWFGDSTLFAKRIPIAEREAKHPLSTKNRYQLPTFYQYGVGSAGFGAFREQAAQAKSSLWVLDGISPSFPLLCHWRVIPNSATSGDVDVDVDYVAYWNGSKAIRRYMGDRMRAPQELWLVLEHVPNQLRDWLRQHDSRTGWAVERVCEAISVMRRHDMVHFDAHFDNVLTDGTEVYITDFGLAVDSEFELTRAERVFLDRHSLYDYGVALWSVGVVLLDLYRSLDTPRRVTVDKRIGATSGQLETLRSLLARVEYLEGPESLDLSREFVESVVRYRDVALLMSEFFEALRKGPNKKARFHEFALRDLLVEAEITFID